MARTMNITITVPEGTTNHGDPNLLCFPTKWTDILAFYAVNYLAHAVTVKSQPGEQLFDTIFVIMYALIYPYSGIVRGMEAICRRAAWTKGNQIQQAARAGALCIVVRSKNWKPVSGSKIKGVKLYLPEADLNEKDPSSVEANGHPETDALWRVQVPAALREGINDPIIMGERTVHGVQRNLPDGYTIAILPSNAVVEPGHNDVAISFSYSVIQAVIAVVQICFASATLYRSRGDQLSLFGYAAFGLTVLPYIIMSIFNLLGNCLTPTYSTLYLVRSPEMAEAEALDAEFDGVVGNVIEDSTPRDDDLECSFEESGDGYLLTYASNFGRYTSIASISKTPNQEISRLDNVDEIEDSKASQTKIPLAPEETATSAQQTVYHLGAPEVDTRPARYSPKLGGGIFYGTDTLDRTRTTFSVPASTRFLTDGPQAWGALTVLYSLGTIFYLVVPIPFAVVGGLTHYHAQRSTKAQRVWITGWMVIATLIGAYMPIAVVIYDFGNKEKIAKLKTQKKKVIYAVSHRYTLVVAYAAFAIGGFVVVGQMLLQYGSCNSLT